VPERRPLLKACLNGGRAAGSIPGLPITPTEVAQAARASWEAGAGAVHVHPRDTDGRERLDARTIGATVSAIRSLVPDLPIGVSTGAWIELNRSRLDLVRSWRILPEFASVNFHEEGATSLAAILLQQGVGVEAGLWTVDAAQSFVRSDVASRCMRILIEPTVTDEAAALRTVDEICAVLDSAQITAPRLVHGTDETTWGVLRAALDAGFDLRIGLEDTTTLPGGSMAMSNEELVAAATRLVDVRMRG